MVNLRDPFLRPSLVCQRPATEDRTERSPVRNALFCGEADGGFGAFLGETFLTTELMEHGSSTQGKTQAKGVRNLLCQRQCVVRLLPSLGWIPQQPPCQGSKDMTHYTSILAIEERRGTMLLKIVERHTLCQMGVRISYDSQPEQRDP